MDFKGQIAAIVAAQDADDGEKAERLALELGAEVLELFQRGVVALEKIAANTAPLVVRHDNSLGPAF